MGKIYSYKKLKGKVQVGWEVRGAPGNACDKLLTGKIGTITKVDNKNFYINDCPHTYDYNYYLEVISPSQKTWETIGCGDELLDNNGITHTILMHQDNIYALSSGNEPLVAKTHLYTLRDLQEWYIIKDLEEPENQTTELTLGEIADKFNIPVDKLRIKEDD